MKILLSAYACEPDKGSEPGVGWNWAVGLSRLGHDVWVVTRANNRATIDAEVGRSQRKNLHFVYYDLPAWAKWWKKGQRGVRLYYLFWQIGAWRLARDIHRNHRLDRVHHVTFVSVRQPSFMGFLGIPFIFGPVAGGERAPWRLRLGYGVRGMIVDGIRDLLNLWVRFDPLMRLTFRRAERIYITSQQTGRLLPRKYQPKARVQLAIGLGNMEMHDKAIHRRAPGSPFRVLYTGNFLYLKGMHLGLAAFSQVSGKLPGVRLTMVGQGPEENRWRRLSKKMGTENKIDWVPWVERRELEDLYRSHDVLLFPSLHDSGGMVVLEAMAHGLPVVCLDLGGPGVIVTEQCGLIVPTESSTEKEVVSQLANHLIRLATDVRLFERLSAGALGRAREFTWDKLIASVYSEKS